MVNVKGNIKDAKESVKDTVKFPTKKSAWADVKRTGTNGLEGAIVGLGTELGNATLGDVIGEAVGGTIGSMFIKDAEAKRWAVRSSFKKSVENLLF